LHSFYDFENKGIFPAVHDSYKFGLLTCTSGIKPTFEKAEFAFFLHDTNELMEPKNRLHLSLTDIALINPNTLTCPVFPRARDVILAKAVYRRVPVLVRETKEGRPEINPWAVQFFTMFNMTTDSKLFHTKETLKTDGFTLEGNLFKKGQFKYLPLYEGKMIHIFDHRWATDVESSNVEKGNLSSKKEDPNYLAMGRYYVNFDDIKKAIDKLNFDKHWLIGFRNIARATDERTIVGGVLPLCAFGNNINLFLSNINYGQLAAILSSFVCDYIARLKVGGVNLNHFIAKQLAVLSPEIFDQRCPWSMGETIYRWIMDRAIELTYTAYDLASYADDCGYQGQPFKWDEERRFWLRCELDAAFFLLYFGADKDGSWRRAEGESREEYGDLVGQFPKTKQAVEYVMETFPIVKRKDVAKYDEYRTKGVILEIYDQLLEAMSSGRSYKTRLEPPPADPSCRHLEK
jgi:hypothetical protein